jgi:hypothetical protein
MALTSLEAVVTAGKLYRVADLEQAIAANQAYFASLLIKPLAQARRRACIGSRHWPRMRTIAIPA